MFIGKQAEEYGLIKKSKLIIIDNNQNEQSKQQTR
jgi:hypothetical protein